ncbi:MAG TPA: hypothetical protein VHX61_12035 [Rhizomicrobium sp.]|jgi:hypothetical protein|nr:hypothetical protein [Rhizomicrobium sp.]
MTNKITPPDTPTIVLAGRAWPIPRLAPRQNRIVVPALLELIPRILRARDEAAAAGETGGFAQVARYLDTAAYDRLTEIAFLALTRAQPDLARAAFEDMPIDTFELIGAVRVIALQAGLIRRAGETDERRG